MDLTAAQRLLSLKQQTSSLALDSSPKILDFLHRMPKTELHLHLAGSIEPSLAIRLAKKHDMIPLSIGSHLINTESELKSLYQFKNLQEFLDLYIALERVLQDSSDFYALTTEYLEKAARDNVRHCELMIGMQQHTVRGVPLWDLFNAINRACTEARHRYGMSCRLVAAFSRHFPVGEGPVKDACPKTKLHSEESANGYFTLSQIISYNALVQEEEHKIVGIGLGGPEVAFPPLLWEGVYKEARDNGLYCIAHAGEEGPPECIRHCIESLQVLRIDHGITSLADEKLVAEMAKDRNSEQCLRWFGRAQRIACTVCPMSNHCLKVSPQASEHPILKMVDKGLLVCVNSDDPPYFGGYLSDNFHFLAKHLGTQASPQPSYRNIHLGDILQLAVNGFECSVISKRKREEFISELIEFFETEIPLLA